jgi:TATA-box binding protein (TBP) (component of TFIID and TFIIIB)
MFDIEAEWNSFLDGDAQDIFTSSYGAPTTVASTPSKSISATVPDQDTNNMANRPAEIAPEPLPLYISTKSIITYFSTPIDIQQVFWNLAVSPYATPAECVIKKEIKLTSHSAEEVEEIKRKIADIPYVKEHVITHISNADGRTKFKDVRKIIVGLSKKDITSCRVKQKGAFYNCLVLIMRIRMDKEKDFREIHVKVFNTGKIEIPGIQNEAILQYILDKLIGYLQPLVTETLCLKDTPHETVLINSNFNCQFYINRESMFSILRSKYRVQCWYDPCCYPGIRCKYTDEAQGLKNVSFMIFRTGSVLIVGKCNEDGIYTIYNYVKTILRDEYANIYQPLTEGDQSVAPQKKKMVRKKKIFVDDTSSNRSEIGCTINEGGMDEVEDADTYSELSYDDEL